MSSSVLYNNVFQAKINNVQNQADTSAVYSAGVWSFKNSTALTSVTIDNSGNVGIGTASPTVPLDVVASNSNAFHLKLRGRASDSVGQMEFWNNANTTRYGFIGADSTSVSINTSGSLPLLFGTNATERMRLDASGNLLVGTTTATNTRLAVKATGTNGNTANIENANNANGDQALTLGLGSNANNTSSYFLICQTPGVANRFFIYGNGTYGTVSDEKLKTNIETARDGYLNDICKLRVVKYNWKTDQANASKELGWIAQEVANVFPGLVQDGPSNEEGEVIKEVKSSVLPFMLLKAIQELSAKNEALEARLAALEAK